MEFKKQDCSKIPNSADVHKNPIYFPIGQQLKKLKKLSIVARIRTIRLGGVK